MLVLYEPGLARFTCAECQKWSYDMKTGERIKYCTGRTETSWVYMDQPRVTPPPCRTESGCFKGSPEKESQYVLNDRNQAMLQWYHEARACGGVDPLRVDGLCRLFFATIDRIIRNWERINRSH